MMAMARKWLGLGGGSSKDGTKHYVKGKPSKETEKAREAFFAHKKKHPTGSEKLTGLQRRMQSGGADPKASPSDPTVILRCEAGDSTLEKYPSG